MAWTDRKIWEPDFHKDFGLDNTSHSFERKLNESIFSEDTDGKEWVDVDGGPGWIKGGETLPGLHQNLK
jgi:hypothetical protein